MYKGQGILAGGYGTNMLPIAEPIHAGVRNEADNGLKNLRYTIAMVRQPDDIDSATSQFFINVADNPIARLQRPHSPRNTATACSAKSSRAWRSWTRSTHFRLRNDNADEIVEANADGVQVVVKSIRRIRLAFRGLQDAAARLCSSRSRSFSAV